MAPDAIYLDESFGFHYPPGTLHGHDLPSDLLAITSPHWLTFPPVHPFLRLFFGCLFFVVWIVSVVGNSVVIHVFLNHPKLRSPSNMLVVALAVSDLLMINTQAPPVWINIFLGKYWAFGPTMCKIYAFAGGVFGTASLWLIILIGYDRYNVIVNGFKGTRVTPTKAFFMILFAFAYSTATVAPALTEHWGKFTPEGMLITCSFDYLSDTWAAKSYTLFLFGTDFALPMLFICWFYGFIVKAVVQHEKALKAQAKKMNVESLRAGDSGDASGAEMRIAKVALTAVCLWLLAWSPYAAVVMLAQFASPAVATPVASQMPAMFAKTASCFNPIVYAISHPNIKTTSSSSSRYSIINRFREVLSSDFPLCFGGGASGSGGDKKTEAETAVTAS